MCEEKIKLNKEQKAAVLDYLLNTAEDEAVFAAFRYDDDFGELFDHEDDHERFKASPDEATAAIMRCIDELRVELGVDPDPKLREEREANED